MLTAVLVLAGAGLGQWPDGAVSRRLRSRGESSNGGCRSILGSRLRKALPVVAGLATLGVYDLLGLPGASGCLLLGLAVHSHYVRHLRMKSSFEAGRRLAEGMRALVLELRAGTHPAAAAEAAAADTDVATATALCAVAAAQRLGGDPEAVAVAQPGAGSDAVARLGHAWTMAQRHGLPLAEVLAAVQRDVAGRVRFATEVHAGMAGVRASAAVLAALPVVGLTFGTLLGARPLHVLAGTAPGQLLLLAGCVLLACGLLWSSRLARNGVRV